MLLVAAESQKTVAMLQKMVAGSQRTVAEIRAIVVEIQRPVAEIRAIVAETQRLAVVRQMTAAENLMPHAATLRSFPADRAMPVFQRKAIESLQVLQV